MAKASSKSVFRKGADAAPQGGGPTNFLKVTEEEPAVFAPLVTLDELVSIDQHEFWETNPAVLFPCIGDGCPACAAGHKPKYKAFLPVVTPAGESKIFAFSISIERQIESIAEEVGSLVGVVLKVKRTGSGLRTKYTVISTGKRVKTAGVTPIDIESEIEVLSGPQITERLEAIGFIDSSSDEEEPAKPAAKPARKAAGKTPAAEATEESGWDEV